MPLTVDSVVVSTEEQVSADLDGEAVVLGLAKGIYYGLDEVGARIWALVREPRTISDIRDSIVTEYDVEPDSCLRDLIQFLEGLETEGLIRVSGGQDS